MSSDRLINSEVHLMRYQDNFYAADFRLDKESMCRLLIIFYTHRSPEHFILTQTIMKKLAEDFMKEICTFSIFSPKLS